MKIFQQLVACCTILCVLFPMVTVNAKAEEIAVYETQKKNEEIAVYETKKMQRTVVSQDGKTVLLTCNYEYPQLTHESSSKYVDKINKDIERSVKKLYQNNCMTGVSYAKEFDQRLQGGEDVGTPSWLPFTSDLSYTIQFNRNGLFSFTVIASQWYGGAHPNYVQQSYTYDLRTGKRVRASDLLDMSEQEIRTYIAMVFNAKATKNPNDYFQDEVKNLLKTKFDYGYYLSEDGFVFYFNPYAIAPYVAGVVSTTLSYKDSKNFIKDGTRFLN